MPVEWNDARIRKLTELWDRGLTSRKIAEEMGDGITRNAVIGKANRLGLKRKPKVETTTETSFFPLHGECKWPFGNPGEDDFSFCREPVDPGKSYCLHHCEIAYRKKST